MPTKTCIPVANSNVESKLIKVLSNISVTTSIQQTIATFCAFMYNNCDIFFQ